MPLPTRRLTENGKEGFTLIELMVVLTIIALLAAVLFPVLAQAREKARQASCLSNLKQIGIAWLQYAQDNEETSVPNMSDDAAHKVAYYWDAAYYYDRPPNYYFDPEKGLLQPYMKMGRVEDCLSAADVNYGPVRYTAYGYNSALWFISLPSLDRTAETLLIADCAQLTVNRQLTRAAALARPSSYKVYTAATLHGRHTGRANLLWADGHTGNVIPRYPDTLPDSAQMHRDNLGYLLPPGVDFDSPKQDYYYLAKKP